MRILETWDDRFGPEFRRIRDRGKLVDGRLEKTVRGILADVSSRGDEALFEYIRRFDGLSLDRETLVVPFSEMDRALEGLAPQIRDILETAAGRIEDFHRRQLSGSWFYANEDGIELGQLVVPLERVGVYVPGGLASYPSTVLMAAIPAKVAGVREIHLATPLRSEGADSLVFAAARLCGVQRIYRMGGAQAIAALAFGTQSVQAVDKIVGPGNAYVATAKRMVYGTVGIDMIAGPSEIMILSDGKVEPSWVAADLLAQAEHDEMASAILLTPVRSFADEVASEVQVQLKLLARDSIASRAIADYGAIIVTRSIEEAIDLINGFAPEHLELVVERPKDFIGKIQNAGAVFLGSSTPEALGDYLAGPNHILPTGGTAKFSSPLGVYDFLKRMNVVSYSPEALRKYGEKAAGFARLEGLDAHARSVIRRLKEKELDKISE